VHTYHLHREQFVARPPSEVFAFFERPENLARITPEALGFVIKTPLPIEMKTGAVIDYTIKVAGLRVGWKTLISDYDPPRKFIDEQLNGPYRYWHHTHEFIAVDGGTKIVDDVRYALPFGFLGNIAHTLLVRHQLNGIFRYREQIIKSIFG
jgi:ligand-binding SRPBCC domain-containing protein